MNCLNCFTPFGNTDVVFVTDGECELPESFVADLRTAQTALRFTVTGVLLDQGNTGMEFSLRSFCQSIYRTNELTGDQVVLGFVSSRV